MCAWEAFSSLVDVPFWGYHPVLLNRWYCQLLWSCRGTSTSYSSAQKVHVAYMRVLTTGCKRGPKCVIHYLLSAHAQVPKMTVKTGPVKTGPAGPLAMTMQCAADQGTKFLLARIALLLSWIILLRCNSWIVITINKHQLWTLGNRHVPPKGVLILHNGARRGHLLGRWLVN